jgi:lipid II:glycine glycyltransferase (peptidoglycan interpeptide bridge formation enzyme)
VNFWREVDGVCRRRRAILLKWEPDTWEDEPAPFAFAQPTPRQAPAGFRLSSHTIQPPRTLLVSLQGSEDALLARMKQKTRYNIRLAEKKGVVVQVSEDLAQFNALMQVTGERDGFGVHSAAYYERAYTLFQSREQVAILLAEFEREPLAALMVFRQGSRAWYLYGASSNNRRELMPTYLLQWAAMRWARQHGCEEYDLYGVPDADEAALEAQFSERQDGLWGVYRFKRGFGGLLRRSAGPWDRVYLPPLYAVYRWRTRQLEGAG